MWHNPIFHTLHVLPQLDTFGENIDDVVGVQLKRLDIRCQKQEIRPMISRAYLATDTPINIMLQDHCVGLSRWCARATLYHCPEYISRESCPFFTGNFIRSTKHFSAS